jgi:hypothetical protein
MKKQSKNQKLSHVFLFSGLLVSSFSIFLFFYFSNFAFAASNISGGANEHWAWNDVIGWIDFKAAPDNVQVFNNRLEGYAGSGVGSIALNCNSTPNGDICGVSNFRVSNNGTGLLSGWAWNDNIGWISFWCGNVDVVNCAAADYRVTIDGNGNFSGWAWSEVVGWISFNCADQNVCGTSNYKLNTTWRTSPAASGDLTSSVFDTGVAEGAALQSLMWQGIKPAGTNVKFQIASSNDSAGPWTFVGPDNYTSGYYVPAGPDVPIALDRDDHNNKRYFRYKVFLESDALGEAAPTIDDIIINWSQ